MDYFNELSSMISSKRLMNSYKLYFLKSIISNITKEVDRFELFDLACWMCAFSFSDSCRLGRRIRPLDKLFDISNLIISKTDILESSTPNQIYITIINNLDIELKSSIKELVEYVPYRLISYFWEDELRGIKDSAKNKSIEAYSRGIGNHLYMIKNYNNEKYIVINPNWKNYIVSNQDYLMRFINNEIGTFLHGRL